MFFPTYPELILFKGGGGVIVALYYNFTELSHLRKQFFIVILNYYFKIELLIGCRSTITNDKIIAVFLYRHYERYQAKELPTLNG